MNHSRASVTELSGFPNSDYQMIEMISDNVYIAILIDWLIDGTDTGL